MGREGVAMSREAMSRKVAWTILGVLLLVVNGFVLVVAAKDRSWGALGMAICVGPIANGVLARRRPSSEKT